MLISWIGLCSFVLIYCVWLIITNIRFNFKYVATFLMDSPNFVKNITWLNFCGSVPFNISKFSVVIMYTEHESSYILYGILSTFLVRITTSSGLTLTQYKFTRVLQLIHGLEDLLDTKRWEVKTSDISFHLFHNPLIVYGCGTSHVYI